MSIEMQCTGCGQTLRVGDDHAGKRARCPSCGTITQVPGSGMAPAPQYTPPAGIPTKPVIPANPFADRPDGANPYQSAMGQAGPSIQPRFGHGYVKPHRGGLVLTLGILGLVCCMPLGIAAWVMGSSDLAEIRRGQMDPSGQSTTQVGMILGIISVAWIVCWFLFGLLAGLA